MHGSINSILVSFNDDASLIYSELFEEFKRSVKKIDRKTDDNVFRLQAAKYFDQLKRKLEREAKRKIEAHPQLQDELFIALTERINFFLQEFDHRYKNL
jgi:hypothetical protein